jgi:hypothetical protein
MLLSAIPRARREQERHRAKREAYGIPAFKAAVPAITARFWREADDMADPCIHYDAETGEIDIVERVELLRHYGEDLIPLGNEIWPESGVVMIRRGDKITSCRIADPRKSPKGWATYI